MLSLSILPIKNMQSSFATLLLSTTTRYHTWLCSLHSARLPYSFYCSITHTTIAYCTNLR